MKKIMIVVIAALILFPAGLKAQNTEKAIAKIRKDYATALEKIKASGDFYDDVFVNCATINIHEMWGGSGPHQEKTEVFYQMGTDEAWSFDRTVFFVRNKYNVSVREFYTEILYDEQGKPEFYYHKAFGYDGKPLEWRFYWNNGKLIRKLVPQDIDNEAFPEEEIPDPHKAYKTAITYGKYENNLYLN